jgi:hypothetical protein
MDYKKSIKLILKFTKFCGNLEKFYQSNVLY